jgi:hypothetical protein
VAELAVNMPIARPRRCVNQRFTTVAPSVTDVAPRRTVLYALATLARVECSLWLHRCHPHPGPLPEGEGVGLVVLAEGQSDRCVFIVTEKDTSEQ